MDCCVVPSSILLTGRDRDDKDTRNALLPTIDKYHVDLVLTGHDHAYSRSYKLNNNVVVKKISQELFM